MHAPKAQGHILVISHDVVGRHMAGPGIRYYHLARTLSAVAPVRLAVPNECDLDMPPGVNLLIYRSPTDLGLAQALALASSVIVPAGWLSAIPALSATFTPIVVDGYDPFVAETLSLRPEEVDNLQAALAQAYLQGDFFICASERQRDWWLGLLEAMGRVNRYTIEKDPSLRQLVDIVPFGLPDEPPRHTRAVIKGQWPGIEPEDRLLLWGGGLWMWLDPLTAIRAVALVVERYPNLRLVFPGNRHPNPSEAALPTLTEAARELARQLNLLDRHVFFGDWVAYDDWPSVLLESELALTLHAAETLESHLAFRSRVLDYVWTGRPIVATRGDATSELIDTYGLGALVEYGDIEGVAAALFRLLDTPPGQFQPAFERARRALTWAQAARPLLEFCRQPRRAPDKAALGDKMGAPHYLRQLDQLQAQVRAGEAQIQSLTAELKTVQARLQVFENGRIHRLLKAFKGFAERLAPL